MSKRADRPPYAGSEAFAHGVTAGLRLAAENIRTYAEETKDVTVCAIVQAIAKTLDEDGEVAEAYMKKAFPPKRT